MVKDYNKIPTHLQNYQIMKNNVKKYNKTR